MTTPISVDDLPIRHEERIHRGNTWRLVVVWEGADLLACVARLAIRDARRNVLLSKSSALGTLSISVDSSGESPVSTLIAEATPVETAAIPTNATAGVLELRVDYSDGTSVPLIKGPVTIYPSVIP